MQNRRINIFDFDETLFRVPGFTCSEAVGLTPYEWYDSELSLSENFPIRAILNTIEVASGDECMNFLITQRKEKFRPIISRLLEKRLAKFERLIFLGRNSKKSDEALELIRIHNVNQVEIYEDSLWEIMSYTAAFMQSEIDVDFSFTFIDKSKIIQIDKATAIKLTESASVQRLIIEE